MPNIDKTTIKVRAYPDNGKLVIPQNTLTEEQNNALELVKRISQLEEEKKKSLELQKTIEQLRESLKQEYAKAAEMEKRIVVLEVQVKESAGLETKAKEFAELEAQVRELNEMLVKISGIAAAGKSA